MTLSEVVHVQGSVGHFTVKVRQNPRYIDTDKCIACGLCAEKCPKKVDDEFNMGVGKRKAAYIKYGQSVPLKYAIDADNCIFLTRGKCRACEKFCPTGAINFEDKPQEVSIQVGAVIMACGFEPYDPSGVDYYGYGKIPDVVTSFEYERMLSAGGPFKGHLVRPSDHGEPRRIAWIQCVGSRNTNRCDNLYCSNVCCMYAIKQAVVTAEHLNGGNCQQTVFYMDIRSHGKEFERYYQSACQNGVRFIPARPHTIEPGSNNSGVTIRYAAEDGRQLVEQFDLAVLSIGLEKPAAVAELASRFEIGLDRFGFARTSGFAPVTTSRPGVYVTGAFQSPKDIPQSVTEASTAAAEVARTLVAARGSMTRTKSYPAEKDVSGQEPAIGVFVCSCGINIANTVDVEAVVEYAKGLPHVVYVENNLFTCSADTQSLIAQKIEQYNLNRIVIAACTPRTHEPMFQDTLREAGLNPYLMEMANIRNQNAWVHQHEPEKATAKAKDQVRMAVARVACNYPLQRHNVEVTRRALVIGGGLAGMNAALAMADQGFDCVLLEKEDRLGGNAWHLDRNEKGEQIRPMLENLIDQVEKHPRIDVLKQATLVSAQGSVGKFSSIVKAGDREQKIQYAVAVVATGGSEYKPRQYLYGRSRRVMTHLELEAVLREDPDRIKQAESMVFIQCVGSRDQERPYCSRVCCTHTMEKAIGIKRLNPAMNIYVLYRDIRTYGQREILYKQARDLGVIFIRYTPESQPQVTAGGDKLQVEVDDPIARLALSIQADYLVLATAIVPNDNGKLVELFKCGTNADGFISEAHPKLRPVDMPVDGMFVAGLCHYPKPVDESIAQARAAASRASVILSQASMQLDAVKSEVTANCDGCALCVDVCPYQAIRLAMGENGGKPQIVTDPALCKGCGLCEATCPKGGILVHGFTIEQLKAQVDAVLEAAGV